MKSSFYNHNKTISSVSSEQIKTFHENFEILLHEMFINPNWSQQYGKQKELKILCYCLYYHYITIQQLLISQLTPMSDYNTEYAFLNRLQNKHYLGSKKVLVRNESVFVYFLTPHGCDQCIQKLKAHAGILNPECSSYQIDSAMLSYFAKRFQQREETINIGHTLSIRDLNLFFLSCKSISTNYHYYFETGVDIYGNLISFFQTQNRSINRTNYLLQCDALIRYPTKQGELLTFVEQDMQTQRIHILKRKIANYITMLHTGTMLYPLTNLVFSLNVRIPPMPYQKQHMQLASRSASVYMNSIELIQWLCEQAQFPCQTVLELITVLQNYEKACGLPLFCKNMLTFFQTIEKEKPGMGLNEVRQNIKEEKIERSFRLKEEKNKKYVKAYTTRKLAIFKGITDLSSSAQEVLLAGFSICTTPNYNHSSVYPYLFPNLFFGIETVKSIIQFYHLVKEPIKSISYTPCTSTFSNDGFVFRNQYLINQNYSLVIENISDDYGGKVRISHYLNSMSFSQKTTLLCLVSDDEVSVAQKMFCESTYARNLYSGLNLAFSVEIYFITYSDFKNKRNVFYFNENGTPSMLPLYL